MSSDSCTHLQVGDYLTSEQRLEVGHEVVDDVVGLDVCFARRLVVLHLQPERLERHARELLQLRQEVKQSQQRAVLESD